MRKSTKPFIALALLLTLLSCARIERMKAEDRDPNNWIGRDWHNYNEGPAEGKCRLFVEGIVTCGNEPGRVIKFYIDKDDRIELLEYVPIG